MRNVAPGSLVVFALTVLAGFSVAASDDFPVGKTAVWEILGEPIHVRERGMTLVEKTSGVSAETPNHRRHRLGQPIVPTFPSSMYGERLETPNQRRQRLGEIAEASRDDDHSGVAEETPNQSRRRIARAIRY